jgi:hypothetical protein
MKPFAERSNGISLLKYRRVGCLVEVRLFGNREYGHSVHVLAGSVESCRARLPAGYDKHPTRRKSNAASAAVVDLTEWLIVLRQDLSVMANPYSAFNSDSTQVRGVMRAAFGFTQPDCVIQIVSGGS